MLGNWVRQTTTTTGTGNLTIASVTGYVDFNTAFGTTQYFRYGILDDATGLPIEAGIGHLSDSTTLVRDWVLATYVGGTYTKVNAASGYVTLASGTKRVICSADATQHVQHYDVSPARLNATANNRIVIPDNCISINAANLTLNIANRLFAWPVYITSRGPFDAFALRVGTTGSAAVDFGLYRMNLDGSPGSLIASSVALSVAGGMNFATFSNVSIDPGWYCFALGNNASSMTCYYAVPGGPSYGRTDTVAAAPMYRVNYTAGTLPDPFGAAVGIGESMSPSGGVPLVALRLA